MDKYNLRTGKDIHYLIQENIFINNIEQEIKCFCREKKRFPIDKHGGTESTENHRDRGKDKHGGTENLKKH